MQPGQFAPKGEDWIGREFAALRQEIRELKAANVFGLTGIKPLAGGTDLDGFVNVNGAMSITGTLSLPAGIINNDALANPSVPYAAHTDIANFALSTGPNVEKLRITIPVPVGFTRAHVFAAAKMNAYNNNASRDEMYMECQINGVAPGFSSEVSAQANSIGFAASNAAAVLTGVSGSFYVSVVASSYSMPWAASTGDQNSINLDVFVTFLR